MSDKDKIYVAKVEVGWFFISTNNWRKKLNQIKR